MSELSVATQDQMEAAIRDLLDANGLEVVDRSSIDVDAVGESSGTEVMYGMLSTAMLATRDGFLSALVAVPDGEGRLGVVFLVVRRKEEP